MIYEKVLISALIKTNHLQDLVCVVIARVTVKNVCVIENNVRVLKGRLILRLDMLMQSQTLDPLYTYPREALCIEYVLEDPQCIGMGFGHKRLFDHRKIHVWQLQGVIGHA